MTKVCHRFVEPTHFGFFFYDVENFCRWPKDFAEDRRRPNFLPRTDKIVGGSIFGPRWPIFGHRWQSSMTRFWPIVTTPDSNVIFSKYRLARGGWHQKIEKFSLICVEKRRKNTLFLVKNRVTPPTLNLIKLTKKVKFLGNRWPILTCHPPHAKIGHRGVDDKKICHR